MPLLTFILNFDELLKVRNSQKQISMSSILPKNERKYSAIVSRAELGKYFVRFLEEFAFEIFELFIPFFVFRFGRRSYENTKILRNHVCLLFYTEQGKMGKTLI